MSRRRGNAKRTRGVGESSPVTGLLPLATPMCDVSAPMLPTSTSSAAAFPVRTCLTLGRALASQVSAAVCGSSSRESFAIYDPASSSWRTSQRSLLAGWTLFSGAFPKRGMMRSGSTFELPTLVRRTDASASSSSHGGEWTTPKASDVERGDCPSERARRTPFLPSQVRATWNTPTVEDAGRNGSPEWARRWAAGETIPEPQQRLRTQVLWPTPDASMGTGGRTGTRGASSTGMRPDGTKVQVTINAVVAMAAKLSQGSAWPTPAARDYKDTGTSPAEFDRNTPGLAACAGGSLNPDWVLALMGFPPDWFGPPEEKAIR